MNKVMVKTIVTSLLTLSVWSVNAADSDETAPAASPPSGYGYGPGMMWGPGYGGQMMRPGYGPGYGGQMGPGYGPGYGGQMGPGYGPGYGGQMGPGYGPGYGGQMGPGYGPGYGGQMGPGYGPGYGGPMMGPGMYYGPRYHQGNGPMTQEERQRWLEQHREMYRYGPGMMYGPGPYYRR